MDEQEIYRQADILARKVGFASFQEAPPVINAMLLQTAPKSPLLESGLADFASERLRALKIGNFRFSAQHLHDCFCDIARGIRYIAKRYPDVKQWKQFIFAPNVEA